MTVALNPSVALPQAQASPLAGLTGRVKRIDPNEFFAVAQAIAKETQATAAPAAATQQETAAAAQAQAQALAQQRAELQAQVAASNQRQATATAATPVATSAARTSTAVAIPSSQTSPRTEHDYWTKHIAQFKGKYLTDGPTMRPNCGPASVTMALRMIGLDIPGFSGQRSEAVLDKARVIATGRNDVSVGTTDTELERVIEASGGRWSESNDFNQMTGWVKQGIPVVLSGNPSRGWNPRYTADQVYPFDGGHWVTVSGYDASTGHYIVNDPLSQIGPIYVSEAELQNYNRAHGNLGIAVFR